MRKLFALIYIGFFVFSISAQIRITGIITDKETGETLAGVVVKIINPDVTSKSLIAYAITNDKGEYHVNFSTECKKIIIAVSSLGFASWEKEIQAQTSSINYALTPHAISLKEVTVKAPPISSSGDTIHYNVSSFISKSDRSIEDVLRKLPGITVTSTGSIEYKGESINKFYIEGLDMMGGKYSLATKNIAAADVTSVQIYENHQPIRLLKGIEYSEKAALNIKLKNNGMSRPAGTVGFGGGYEKNKMLYMSEIYGLTVSKSKQMMFTAKGKNRSSFLNNENKDHLRSNRTTSKSSELISGIPITLPPVIKDRSGENKLISGSFHSIKKLKKESVLAVNSDYLHLENKYLSTRYAFYFDNASPVAIYEEVRPHLLSDVVNSSIKYETNDSTLYLLEDFFFTINLKRNNTLVMNDNNINQQYVSKDFGVHNSFRIIKKKRDKVYDFSSYLSFINTPNNILTVKNPDNALFLQQEVSGFSLISRHGTSFLKSLTRRSSVMADLNLDGNYDALKTILLHQPLPVANHNNGFKHTTTAKIKYSYEKNKFRYNLTFPLSLVNINYKDAINNKVYVLNKPYLNFGASARYAFNEKMFFLASAQSNNLVGDMMSFVTNPIQRAYNEISSAKSGILAEQYLYNISSSLEYRNTMNGVFSSFRIGRSGGEYNLMNETMVSGNGTVSSLSLENRNKSYGYNGYFYIAKNIRDIGTTLSLSATALLNNSESMRQGVVYPHTRKTWILSPVVRSSPVEWFSLNAHFIITANSMTIAAANKKQESKRNDYRTSLEMALLPFCNIEIYYRLDYDNIENRNTQRKSSTFMDAGCRYMGKIVEVELKTSNLTNQTTYNQLFYTELDQLQYTYRLQPRNVMLSVKLRY